VTKPAADTVAKGPHFSAGASAALAAPQDQQSLPTRFNHSAFYEAMYRRPAMPRFSSWTTSFSWASGMSPVFRKRFAASGGGGYDVLTSLARADTNGDIALEASIVDGDPWNLMPLGGATPNGDSEENSCMIWQYVDLPPLTSDAEVDVTVHLDVSRLVAVISSPHVVDVSTKVTAAVYFIPDQAAQPVATSQELYRGSHRGTQGYPYAKYLDPSASAISLGVSGIATPATRQLIVIVTAQILVERQYAPSTSDGSAATSKIEIGPDGTLPTMHVAGIWVAGR
jgi:hypothetical protein